MSDTQTLRGLTTVSFWTDDLAAAKKWYAELLGIEPYFDVVLVSGDIGINKPDRGVFDYLCARLGCRNEECMMIGDVFATDILGAVNAGCVPVWLNRDPELPAKHYHGYQIARLKDLLQLLEEVA